MAAPATEIRDIPLSWSKVDAPRSDRNNHGSDPLVIETGRRATTKTMRFLLDCTPYEMA